MSINWSINVCSVATGMGLKRSSQARSDPWPEFTDTAWSVVEKSRTLPCVQPLWSRVQVRADMDYSPEALWWVLHPGVGITTIKNRLKTSIWAAPFAWTTPALAYVPKNKSLAICVLTPPSQCSKQCCLLFGFLQNIFVQDEQVCWKVMLFGAF